MHLLYQHIKITETVHNTLIKKVTKIKKMITKSNKIIMITEPKTIHFDLNNEIDNNIKTKIYFILKPNEFLAEHTIKMELDELLFKIILKTTINIDFKLTTPYDSNEPELYNGLKEKLENLKGLKMLPSNGLKIELSQYKHGKDITEDKKQ